MNMLVWNNNEQINFAVSVPEWKNTDSLSSSKTSRATPITDASLSTSNTFNLIADQNDGTGNYSILINKETVSFTNNIWQTTPSHYYWSGIANKTVNFYAYYPTSISGNISHTAGSAPTLLYTVPPDASNQIDIITAINPNISGSTVTSTSLTFNHIFAAVKFAVGTNGLPSGTIKSITISGINNSGTYTFGNGWTPGSTTSSFTVSPSTAITGSAGANITSDVYTLMMIPQVFSNAIVSLVYNNGTAFSTTISGTWNAGGVYTYNLSKTIIYNYDYTGGLQIFTAPYTGTYKLETWGGGSNGAYSGGFSSIGLGGYAVGTIYIASGTKLYIYIGGVGKTNNGLTGGAGGYNGGGNGENGTSYAGGSGGGGATHIAITDRGVLNNYSSYKNELLIIAGGAGGSAINSNAGTGGGLTGGSAATAGWSSGGVASITINGGTQNSGYLFGKGQDGGTKSVGGMAGAEGNGGGGGGWYGGFSYTGSGDGSCCGGSGGSGYIGGVSGGSMQNGVRSGNGYARITFVSAN
ncbi:fimbrillin family protein [Prevotella herbatica]|uniref:receptor protein-tyrosine kinase n=2 Tax=Prevotella herbatica TaxID=2801997 RepID=A0ABN6EIS2_9BACT|nr:fimbrillin family protein [Prevotella herbatica]